MNNQGFTLLETIIYMALLTLLLFGMILPLAALRDSMQRTRTHARLVDEALYFDDVFDQRILAASVVEFPTLGKNGSQLSLILKGVPLKDYVASTALVEEHDGEIEPISDGDIEVGILNVSSYTGSTTPTNITIHTTLSAWDGRETVLLPYEHTTYLEL